MEKVTLNEKEQKRLLVFNEVLAGRMTGQEAAEMLAISLRHTRRLLARYRLHGAAGLMHGNRGREPVNKVSEEVENVIVYLAQTEYVDYNDSHFTEELAERHEIGFRVPRCAGSGGSMGCAVRANDGHRNTGAGGNGIRKPGCCSRWTGASTTGWKGAGRG